MMGPCLFALIIMISAWVSNDSQITCCPLIPSRENGGRENANPSNTDLIFLKHPSGQSAGQGIYLPSFQYPLLMGPCSCSSTSDRTGGQSVMSEWLVVAYALDGNCGISTALCLLGFGATSGCGVLHMSPRWRETEFFQSYISCYETLLCFHTSRFTTE